MDSNHDFPVQSRIAYRLADSLVHPSGIEPESPVLQTSAVTNLAKDTFVAQSRFELEIGDYEPPVFPLHYRALVGYTGFEPVIFRMKAG